MEDYGAFETLSRSEVFGRDPRRCLSESPPVPLWDGVGGRLALAGKRLANIVDPSIRAYASTKLDGVIKGPFSTDEKVTPEKNATTYNNYYEFGTEKDEPAKNSQKFQTSPWSVRRRRSGEAAEVYDGRNPKACAARGTNLHAPVCGGLVHRSALDRLFLRHAREGRRAQSQRQVRSI